MKKVNLNFELTSLDGKEIGNAGKIIANNLVSQSKGDALKFYDWAVTFNKGEEVQMDSSDFKMFNDSISNNDHLTILAKGQILKYLDSIK